MTPRGWAALLVPTRPGQDRAERSRWSNRPRDADRRLAPIAPRRADGRTAHRRQGRQGGRNDRRRRGAKSVQRHAHRELQGSDDARARAAAPTSSTSSTSRPPSCRVNRWRSATRHPQARLQPSRGAPSSTAPRTAASTAACSDATDASAHDLQLARSSRALAMPQGRVGRGGCWWRPPRRQDSGGAPDRIGPCQGLRPTAAQ